MSFFIYKLDVEVINNRQMGRIFAAVHGSYRCIVAGLLHRGRIDNAPFSANFVSQTPNRSINAMDVVAIFEHVV